MKFERKDSKKKLRIGNSWRKPKGMHNKRRLQKSGHAKIVKPGFGKKKGEKNKVEGKEIMLVSNLEDLKKANPKEHTLSIARTSKKKKLAILEEAKKQKFTFVNFNPERFEEKINKDIAEKKAEKAKRLKRKEKQKEKQKEAEKKEESKKEEKKDSGETSKDKSEDKGESAKEKSDKQSSKQEKKDSGEKSEDKGEKVNK